MYASLSTQFLPTIIVAVYLVALLIVAESLSHFPKTDSELTRKIVHIGSGNVILLAWWLNITADIILLASFVASLVAMTSYFVPILPGVNGVGRKSLGTLFYALSIGILVVLFWQGDTKQFTTIAAIIRYCHCQPLTRDKIMTVTKIATKVMVKEPSQLFLFPQML